MCDSDKIGPCKGISEGNIFGVYRVHLLFKNLSFSYIFQNIPCCVYRCGRLPLSQHIASPADMEDPHRTCPLLLLHISAPLHRSGGENIIERFLPTISLPARTHTSHQSQSAPQSPRYNRRLGWRRRGRGDRLGKPAVGPPDKL